MTIKLTTEELDCLASGARSHGACIMLVRSEEGERVYLEASAPDEQKKPRARKPRQETTTSAAHDGGGVVDGRAEAHG